MPMHLLHRPFTHFLHGIIPPLRMQAGILQKLSNIRKSQHIFAKKIKKFQTQAAKAVEKTASADRKPRISRG